MDVKALAAFRIGLSDWAFVIVSRCAKWRSRWGYAVSPYGYIAYKEELAAWTEMIKAAAGELAFARLRVEQLPVEEGRRLVEELVGAKPRAGLILERLLAEEHSQIERCPMRCTLSLSGASLQLRWNEGWA
jgi:hypothetical protein